jgi:hypothetical protein
MTRRPGAGFDVWFLLGALLGLVACFLLWW